MKKIILYVLSIFVAFHSHAQNTDANQRLNAAFAKAVPGVNPQDVRKHSELVSISGTYTVYDPIQDKTYSVTADQTKPGIAYNGKLWGMQINNTPYFIVQNNGSGTSSDQSTDQNIKRQQELLKEQRKMRNAQMILQLGMTGLQILNNRQQRNYGNAWGSGW